MGKKQPKEKHIPMRMCIVTGERKPKAELMRFVRVEDKVAIDPKGKVRGRGANICMDCEIFDKAVKKHLIEKALKIKHKFTPDEIKSLREEFTEAIELKTFRKGSKPVVIKVDQSKWKKVVKE